MAANEWEVSFIGRRCVSTGADGTFVYLIADLVPSEGRRSSNLRKSPAGASAGFHSLKYVQQWTYSHNEQSRIWRRNEQKYIYSKTFRDRLSDCLSELTNRPG
jgi:hypothetical protein